MLSITATIIAAAKTIGVPASLLLAICTQESALVNVMVPRDGFSSSFGICQIKEATARMVGFKGIATGPLVFTQDRRFRGDMVPYGKPHGLMIPSVNAKYAAKYLKQQLDNNSWNWCRGASAYNSGTYHQSKKFPWRPKNYNRYIKKVALNLDDVDRDSFLACDRQKVVMK